MKHWTQFLLLLVMFFCSLPAVAQESPLGTGLNLIDEPVDRQQELQRIFDRAAQTGQRVQLPAGIFRHSGFLYIRGIEVSGTGPDTIIEGTTRDHSAVILTGKGAKLSNVRMTYRSTTRSLDIRASEVLVENADDFEVSNLMIDGGDCAGILMSDSHRGIVRDNDIRSTLADSIHMTNGSSDIVVHDNTTHFSGDDGVAVVSYERDGKKVHNIEAFHNTIIDNKVARGMSVVGGDNVYYHDNFIKCTRQWAGIYIASEKVFKTYGSSNVKVQNNIVKDCGGVELGHGAVTIASDYNENKHILFEGNVLADSKATGFHVIGKGNADVSLKNNVIMRTKSNPILVQDEVPPVELSGNTVLGVTEQK